MRPRSHQFDELPIRRRRGRSSVRTGRPASPTAFGPPRIAPIAMIAMLTLSIATSNTVGQALPTDPPVDETPEVPTPAAPDPPPSSVRGPGPETDEAARRRRASQGLEVWNRKTLTGDWWDVRSTWQDAGVDLQASLVYDVVSNLAGGIRTGTTDPYLFNAQIEFDLETLFGLEGAEFFALGQIAGGGNPSVEFVGDYQGVDNNAIVGSLGQLSQIWYRQRLFDDRMSVQLGKLDFLASFASPSVSATFINNGLDYPSTLNVSSPTFPNQAFGILVEGSPIDGLELKAGLYDGSNPPAIGAPSSGTGGLGPATFFDNVAGYFAIGEAKLSWKAEGRPGALAAGGWGHTGEFPSFSGGRASGTHGAYAYLQQAMWLADEDAPDGAGISIFAIASVGEASTNPVRWSLSGGLSWRGPIPSRPDDQFGIGVAYARFTDEGSFFPRPGECAIEAFYSVQVTPWLSIQPDLQYVIDPGGDAVATENALVGILRMTITF